MNTSRRQTVYPVCPFIGRLVPPEEVAAYFKVDERTLRRWSTDTEFPRPIKQEGSVRYIGSEIAEWVEKKMTLRTVKEVSHGNT